MSYDLLICQSESEQGNKSGLGNQKKIVDIFNQAFKGVEWESPDFGVCEDGKGSMEINIGNEEIIESFGVVLRGDFYELMERLHNIAKSQGWEIFDPQAGDVI